MPEIKITVLRRAVNEDLQEEYGHEELEAECPILDEGQEFTIDPEEFDVPDGFCAWAWDAIVDNITVLAFGGDFGVWNWSEDKDVAIVCCNDGLRPVYFKLEKME